MGTAPLWPWETLTLEISQEMDDTHQLPSQVASRPNLISHWKLSHKPQAVFKPKAVAVVETQ